MPDERGEGYSPEGKELDGCIYSVRRDYHRCPSEFGPPPLPVQIC